MEAPSSFLKAFTLQPGSTTMTLIGRQLSSTPRAIAASIMRSACLSVIVVMGGYSWAEPLPGPCCAIFRDARPYAARCRFAWKRPESGLDRLDSVSVRVDELVKDL